MLDKAVAGMDRADFVADRVVALASDKAVALVDSTPVRYTSAQVE